MLQLFIKFFQIHLKLSDRKLVTLGTLLFPYYQKTMLMPMYNVPDLSPEVKALLKILSVTVDEFDVIRVGTSVVGQNE